jgi:predicted RNase H-like nuclease
MPKIADVDGVMTPELQDRVFENHPEVSFHAASNGELLPPKKRAPGRGAREALLRRLGYPELDAWFAPPWPPRARADDLLDACIACWTARRVATEKAQRIPENPAIDARGLRMEIWA